jgi:hypothetical protein
MKLTISRDFIFDNIGWEDSYKDVYPGYSAEESEFPDEYYFESKEKADNFVDDILGLFNDIYNTNTVLIYRSIAADSEDKIDKEMLGNHWSFEEYSAKNFARYSLQGNVFLVYGKTDKDNIDWEESIIAYLHFSGGETDEDENELVIIDESDIEIIKIEQIRKVKEGVSQSKNLNQNIFKSKGSNLIISQIEKKLEVKFLKIGTETLRKKRSDSEYIRKNPHLKLYAMSYNILDYTWLRWLEKSGRNLFELPERKITKAPVIKFYFDSRSGEESLGLVYIEIYTPKWKDSTPTYTYEVYNYGIAQLINAICRDLSPHVNKKSELEKEYARLLDIFLAEGGSLYRMGRTIKYTMIDLVEYASIFDLPKTNMMLKELIDYKKYFHEEDYTNNYDDYNTENPYRVASRKITIKGIPIPQEIIQKMFGKFFIKSKSVDDILRMVDWDLYHRRKYYGQLLQPWVNRVYASTVETKCKSSKYNKNGKIYIQKVLFKDFIVLAKDKEISIADSVKYCIEDNDVHVICNCPSALYHGFAYIQTRGKFKYGLPENRPPVEKNPALRSSCCKHEQRVLNFIKQNQADIERRFNALYRNVDEDWLYIKKKEERKGKQLKREEEKRNKPKEEEIKKEEAIKKIEPIKPDDFETEGIDELEEI